jgi:hypothetical protein
MPSAFIPIQPARDRSRVERETSQGGGAQRTNISQEPRWIQHFEMERHLAHSPFQALQHLRQRLLPAAHAHCVEPRLTVQSLPHQTQPQRRVGAVDYTFRKWQAVVFCINCFT